MSELLATVSHLSTLVFAASSMVTVGLSYTFAQILAPLRDGRAVGRALLANFVLVPLMAFGVIRVLDLPTAAAMGLLLLATAAGSPFMIKLTAFSGGNIGMAAGLLVMLIVATIAYMPIVVPLFAPDVAVDAKAVAMPLVLSMLVPLVAGLVIDSTLPKLASRVRPLTGPLSSAALVVLMACLLAIHFPAILALIDPRSMIAAVTFPLGAFGIGHLLERRGIITGEILALGTAQRNVGAALVVAMESFHDARISLMIVFVSIVTLSLLFLFAWLMRRRRPNPP